MPLESGYFEACKRDNVLLADIRKHGPVNPGCPPAILVHDGRPGIVYSGDARTPDAYLD